MSGFLVWISQLQELKTCILRDKVARLCIVVNRSRVMVFYLALSFSITSWKYQLLSSSLFRLRNSSEYQMFELFCQLFAQAIFIFVRDEKWMLTLVNVVWLPANWLVLQRRTRHGYLKEQSKAKPFVSGRGCKRWQFCGIYVSGLLKIIVLVISFACGAFVPFHFTCIFTFFLYFPSTGENGRITALPWWYSSH